MLKVSCSRALRVCSVPLPGCDPAVSLLEVLWGDVIGFVFLWEAGTVPVEGGLVKTRCPGGARPPWAAWGTGTGSLPEQHPPLSPR